MHLTIARTMDTEQDPFDRQKRIEGWKQERLTAARVMVVGAGAIGNETLKNLALLGIGNILIVDFDDISMSNLSRTLLFRRSDAGKLKAEVAARATAELSPNSALRIDWFNGDLAWELGVGIFRNVDLVLGCVDNVETRFAINRRCWLAGTPWIDAGIHALAGHVAVYDPRQGSACYECSASSRQWTSSRVRYSCDDFKRAMKAKELAPTVQVSSALVSALQVQEAVKLLCDAGASVGKKIIFQGTTNDYDLLSLKPNPACFAHAAYDVISAPLSSDLSLREFLVYASGRFGIDACLDLATDLTFVLSATCRLCSRSIPFNRPAFRIYDTESYCEGCRGSAASAGMDDQVPTEKETASLFSLAATPPLILDLTLNALGLPRGHVAAVTTAAQDRYFYLELSNDVDTVFPNIGHKLTV
jgi:molybdopterin/thiamine biosynthesis adenylyltransferase